MKLFNNFKSTLKYIFAVNKIKFISILALTIIGAALELSGLSIIVSLIILLLDSSKSNLSNIQPEIINYFIQHITIEILLI